MPEPLLLNPAEARVIAALVEKSLTTPQYYPMTVNAIMLAANQKSCRSPLMSLSEGEAGAALNALEQHKLCARDDNLGRVPKWRHQFQHQMLLQPPTMAVLVTLILRGPQTLSELRANAASLGGPADAEGVMAAVNDLADRAQPLVVLLPRAVGQKEARYAHTLCGTPSVAPSAATETPTAIPAAAPASGATLVAALEERLRALEDKVAALEQRLTT